MPYLQYWNWAAKLTTRLLKNLSIVWLWLPGVVHAVDGANVFDTRCRLCHQSATAFEHSRAKELKEVLRSNTIEEHRFALSEDEIQAVVRFLKQGRSE